MSKLKWNWAYAPYLDPPEDQKESAQNAGYVKVVSKDEADKVIALLTDKANYNEYAYKHKSEEFADTCRFYEDELRHHKYKRCLAMARLCHERSLWWYSKGYGFEKYDKFWEKWEKRWLELAEKFKEAK